MSTASPPRPVAVLDHAVAWTHECLELARGTPLTAPTPCAAWDLGRLLLHMEESLVVLTEAAELGRVAGAGQAPPPATGELVDRLVRRACTARTAWHRHLTSAPITVGDLPLGRTTVALVGALEIAVHGWDVSCAAGGPQEFPEDLAVRLYDVALAVVAPHERGRRFGPAVPVPGSAPTGTRLLAHLGRSTTEPRLAP